MDKIFMVSILVTFVGSATMTAFQDALNDIDNECLQSGSPAVPTSCNQQKSEVETPFLSNDLTLACTNLGAYKTCLGGACDPNTEVDTLIATMETTCGLSPSVKNFLGVLIMIDNKCTASASDPCATEMNEVDTQLQSDSLTEACKKLPAYTKCMNSACNPNTDLTKFIDSAEEKCAITDFLDVLNIVDNQCRNDSKAVTAPCAANKTAVDTHLSSGSLTDACTKLPGYKMCLLINCDSSTDLSNSISKMENTCDMSPSEVTDLQDVLNIIDSLCVKNSVAVAKPCPTEKQEMNTQLQSDSLTEACKELPDYKTCLLRDCDKAKNLTRSIDIMEDKCGSGFMKISVSMLTLFLAAIVNFL